jgi:maleylpyruvate isomerase
MKLYNFFRSGTSHRLRIALNLKGLAYEYVAVDLRTEQHLGADYKALNPQGLVPAVVDDGRVLIQSPAIIEWLEERHPTPPLEIDRACAQLDAFRRAAPALQPDAA